MPEISADVDYMEIDVSEDPGAISKYRIQGTPTMIILGKDGGVSDTLVGVPSADELKSALHKAATE
jgi:protein-disulfide isomerase